MTATPCTERPDIDWHADNANQRAQAALICRDCPIQLECAEGAINRRETWGVWGGFDFEDITQHAKERERRWAQGVQRRPQPGCGDRSGANRHYRKGEKPCELCALALNAHRRNTRKDRSPAA